MEPNMPGELVAAPVRLRSAASLPGDHDPISCRTRPHEFVRRDCRTDYLCHDADDRRATAVSVRG